MGWDHKTFRRQRTGSSRHRVQFVLCRISGIPCGTSSALLNATVAPPSGEHHRECSPREWEILLAFVPGYVDGVGSSPEYLLSNPTNTYGPQRSDFAKSEESRTSAAVCFGGYAVLPHSVGARMQARLLRLWIQPWRSEAAISRAPLFTASGVLHRLLGGLRSLERTGTRRERGCRRE